MSSRKTMARGAMMTDRLMVVLGNRSYGAYMEAADRLAQEIPDFLLPIAVELRTQSKLLEMDPLLNPDHEAIFAAYRIDVGLLQGRLDDLENLIKHSVGASMLPGRKAPDFDNYPRAETSSRRVEQNWDTIKAGIPQVQNVPLIDLSAERAAEPADQLLTELKAEVEAGIDRLLRRVCFWLDELVDREYIGLVAFTAPNVGHYYYFRPSVDQEEVDRKETSTYNEDPTQPYGVRITYQQVNQRTLKITENLERHDHHIVRAKVESLYDFQGRMPNRLIYDLLDRTPAWLRPHLTVVSGDITKEEIRRRVIREQQQTEEIVSVWKDSPAIALGPYALAGWSSDDLEKESSGFYHARRLPLTERQRKRREKMLVISAVAALLVFAGSGISYCSYQVDKSTSELYQAYQTEHTGRHKVFMIQTDQTINLPEGQPLYYLGNDGSASSVEFSPTFTADPVQAWNVDTGRRSFNNLDRGPDGIHYGDVDLGPSMGIPATMHILRATPDKIVFTIDYRNRQGYEHAPEHM